MKRFFYSITPIVILFSVFLTACASPAANSPKLDGKSLRVVTTYGPNDGGHLAFIALCDEYSETTGAEIQNQSSDSSEQWKQTVISDCEKGNEPDVLFFFTGPDADGLIRDNKFVSIDEIRQTYPDYASNINLAVLEGLKASDGKGYAVPVKGYWERLFVNMDIFDQLSISPPKTYEDFFTIAPTLVENGYIPIAASLNEVPHYLFEAFLFNLTGPANHLKIPEDPGNPPESWVLALNEFPRMYEAKMFPNDNEAATHADAFELFQSKKAAMIVDGDWSVAYIRDTENVAVINFPTIPGGPRNDTDLISGFSMGFYISRKAWDDPEKRDLAVDFVEFITSNQSIMKLNVSGAAMPISIAPSEAASNEGATPLRRSIDALNETTTAFVGAAADQVTTEARAWLFANILPLSKGETDAETLLNEFISINNKKN